MLQGIMNITIIILTHHRIELLKLCLQSIENQLEHPFNIEIKALVNGEDEDSRAFLKNWKTSKNKFEYKLLDKALPVGEARNILINSATGKYLCFIDDDVEIPQNYFQTAAKYIDKYPDADVFGGPDQSKCIKSDFQLILSAVMKSYFAMGPTRARHFKEKKITKGTEINLILCNLWMKKELFEKGFAFPKDYIRNEENILLAEIEKANHKMLYLPDLFVYHERKHDFKKLIRVTYLSGMYRMIGFFDQKNTFHFIFLIPILFIALLISGLVYSGELFLVMIGAYFLVIGILSFKICIQLKKISRFYYAVLFYMIYNFIYPIGLIRGGLYKLRKKL